MDTPRAETDAWQGEGLSHGAITVINGIPSGKGGAIGIRLSAKASVRLSPRSHWIVNGASLPGHPAAVTAQLILQDHKPGWGADIRLSSEIPMAKGLKSSSAIQVATALGVYDALGEETPGYDALLPLLVAAARQAGVTITGGLDDIAACLLGGMVLTHNEKNLLLFRRHMPELPVVLIVPERSILTASVKFERSPLISTLFNRLHELAFAEPYLAMTLNGLLYMDLAGLDNTPVRTLLRAPVKGVGLTGKGPCVAIICEPEDLVTVERLASTYGPVVTTRVSNEGIPYGV